MLTVSPPTFLSILPDIKEKTQKAFAAAVEQLNLLSACTSSPTIFDKVNTEKFIPQYSQQAHEMRLVQNQCAAWLHEKNITALHTQSIFDLELESIRLEKISEKIIVLLRFFSKESRKHPLPEQMDTLSIEQTLPSI